MTKRELEAEVRRLRDEVALLRSQQVAHVCPQWPANLTWPYPPAQPQCTCGTTMGCQAHPFPKPYINVWQNTACAAPLMQTFTVKPGQEYAVTGFLTTGCAAPAPQILTFNVPA